jgi:triosephosphate isomerase
MPDRYLIANWKMNLPPEGVESYLWALSNRQGEDVEVVVAPPFPYIRDVAREAGSNVGVAGQNCADQRSGAFTGEVSPVMLAECGANYVIIGHSERRSLYGENDALIARKLALAIECGLVPVLCIGEDLRTREAGHVARFLADQVREAAVVPALQAAKEVIVAYEPIWAIGTGRNATGAMCAETIADIRDALGRFWPARFSDLPILYGGSVTPDNVGELVANGRMDGFLVGGASLDSAKFLALHQQLAST